MRRPTLRIARTGAAAAALVVAASCGVAPGHTLDANATDANIASQLESQYRLTGVKVECPNDIPDNAGQAFVCSATLDSQPLLLDATVLRGGGHFAVNPVYAVLAVDSTESLLAREIGSHAHTVPAVDCGPRTVLVSPVGGTFMCSATFAGTPPRVLTVTVDTRQGLLHYVLAPAAS